MSARRRLLDALALLLVGSHLLTLGVAAVRYLTARHDKPPPDIDELIKEIYP